MNTNVINAIVGGDFIHSINEIENLANDVLAFEFVKTTNKLEQLRNVLECCDKAGATIQSVAIAAFKMTEPAQQETVNEICSVLSLSLKKLNVIQKKISEECTQLSSVFALESSTIH